jgi:uncharacterized protein
VICAINIESSPGVFAFSHGEIARVAAAAKPFWVAEVNEVVVGYLIGYAHSARYDGDEFVWFQSRAQNCMYIDQVAIASPARRQGIGSMLYNALEEVAAHEGFTSLACEVNQIPANPHSMAFHLDRGFTAVDRLRTGDGRLVALLCKRLGHAV